MLRVQLTRLHTNHKRLRTDVVEGITTNLPRVGYPFEMNAPSLTEGEGLVRFVGTSSVKELKKENNTYTFTTASGSTYEVVLLVD